MNAIATLVSVHLVGEGKDEICLDTLPGKITVTRTDEALTPYGGLAAWSGFAPGVVAAALDLKRRAELAQGMFGFHAFNGFVALGDGSVTIPSVYPENSAAMKTWSQLSWRWFGVELDFKAELAEAAG